MRVRRVIGSLLATALAATTMGVVATAAPASAVTVVTTKVEIQLSKTKTEYGDKISVSGNVTGQNADGTWGTLPYGSGAVTLQFLPKGSTTWQNLQVDDSGYSFYFYPVSVKSSGTFQVYYGGGTYEDYQFSPSATTKIVQTERKLTYKEVPGRRTGIQGKIAPAAKIKIQVLKKSGKKFRHYKTVRTNGKGRFKVVLPAPRHGRFHWKIVFAGGKSFAPSVVRGSTYKSY